LIKTSRISDGIVRLYYVARDRAIEVMNTETKIMNKLCETWGVDQSQIEKTASRFFNEYKKLSAQTKKQDQQILNLQVMYLLKGDETRPHYAKSEQEDPTLYISSLPQYAEEFKAKNKGIIFCGGSFCCGLLGNPTSIDVKALEVALQPPSSKPLKVITKDKVTFKFKEKGRKPVDAKGVLQLMIMG
jgi:hypothetical protein